MVKIKKSFWKDTFREITRSFGRYFSLILITALGSASVAGILATAIDMRAIADKTFKARGLYDIHLKSTTGFADDDISGLLDISGVGIVMPTSIFDVYVYFENETRTMRTFSLPDDLNKIELVAGRLPETANECAVERAVLRHWGLQIGDAIKLGLDNMDNYHKALSSNEFTITGTVASPFFIIPHDRGTTQLGDGRLNYYLYLHPDAFELEVYTDVYIQMEESQNIHNLSGEYYDSAEDWLKLVKLTGETRVQANAEELIDAQREIDDGWTEYHDGVAELEEKISDAWSELNDAEAELEEALAELKEAADKLEDAELTLESEISDAIDKVNKNERDVLRGLAEIEANRQEIKSGQDELDQARESLLGNMQVLESMAPYGISPELDMQYHMIFGALELLDEKQLELDAGRAALDAADRAARDGLVKISEARVTIEQERADAQAEINDGWEEYNDGLRKYDDGLAKWRDGIVTLETEEADAITELEDAKLKLEEAQEKLDDAPNPEWFYFLRVDNQAFESYYQDTLRLEGIGYVFPIVFFVVAVLVSLTTMTRMVDEQRTQIGIYKALGYGTPTVILKLLIYSFSAGVTGGLLGVIAGSNLFPRVIYGAYMHLYDMPPIETPIPADISLTAIATSVGIVMIVTVFTSLRSMRATPAEMMRPKTPPSGKRVLIEKIPFIWNRLKFTSKVTARNIFRYKKRFIMTLAGLAGCTAILLTSFGLRDSLAAISELQYNKLISYTSKAYLKDITTVQQRDELENSITGERLFIREESLSATGCSFSVSMIVPESTERSVGFMSFVSRKSGEQVAFDESGILVTEKLARAVGVSAGDNFIFSANDGGVYTVPISGIIENYVMHHIYMPPGLYLELFGAEPLYNSVLIISDEASVGALLENSDVRAIIHTSDLHADVADSTDALEIVAIVLIFLACALAFVVLFNLTNINIIERIRELATIKVLGFYNEELSMYIYRENAIVTLMGIILGLFAGVFLHGYVLQAAEIDLLMFPRTILPLSYVYSAALSISFAVFVNLVMNVKLARIDMVESLKNVE